MFISRSREGAWIESIGHEKFWRSVWVAPVRERGLKGLRLIFPPLLLAVAPVRERGLKGKVSALTSGYNLCRSREGAWIESSP